MWRDAQMSSQGNHLCQTAPQPRFHSINHGGNGDWRLWWWQDGLATPGMEVGLQVLHNIINIYCNEWLKTALMWLQLCFLLLTLLFRLPIVQLGSTYTSFYWFKSGTKPSLQGWWGSYRSVKLDLFTSAAVPKADCLHALVSRCLDQYCR